MDLGSRLRAIVKGGPQRPIRELTYEPDTGGYEATVDLDRMGEILGGRPVETPFGRCLVIDRRYEADRFHGTIRIGECEVTDAAPLSLLDPSFCDAGLYAAPGAAARDPCYVGQASTEPPAPSRTLFVDLETTGLSGGAGTLAFLVGCGYFDLGAFQVRQFLLTSYASERALLSAVADFFEGTGLLVTYNGKTFDVPVMETRWAFHRMDSPDLTSGAVPHFDMLHPARRLWRNRQDAIPDADGQTDGCRLSTLERVLFDVERVGDVPGLEVPGRYFQFLRSGDPRPLEPVLEHNRIDLVSLAAVMARAVRLVSDGPGTCRDAAETLALGRVYERAGLQDRAEDCYARATRSECVEIRGEALYRLGLRMRRDKRFEEAASVWRTVMEFTPPRSVRRHPDLSALRRFAAEALAIHHEHRDRDFVAAKEVALFALEDADRVRADRVRYRLARLDRKLNRRGRLI